MCKMSLRQQEKVETRVINRSWPAFMRAHLELKLYDLVPAMPLLNRPVNEAAHK